MTPPTQPGDTRSDDARSDDAEALRARILDGPGPDASAEVGADLAALLAALDAHGTPLITDHPDDPDCQRVLLAFHAPPSSAGVYAWVNRLTDGPHQARGQLQRWGDSDLWFTELTVARGTMATYRFYAYADGDPHLRDGAVVYSRTVAARAVSDPANSDADSPFGSVLRTAGAPDLARWHPRASGTASSWAPIVSGTVGTGPDASRWRLTEPVGGGTGPTRIVVLFDAQNWLDRFGLTTVLADTLDADDDPIAVLGIDAPPNPAERLRQLGPDRAFLAAIAGDILDEARRSLRADETRTVWAGQSLGAVSALAAACWFGTEADEVLAYSPSMWWKPGITARPAHWADERPWLADELGGTPPRPVRLAVGSNESLLVGPVTDLAHELSQTGWPVTLHRFDGGHDVAWWAHELLGDLTVRDGKVVQP